MTINKKIDLGPAIERSETINNFLELLADAEMPIFRVQYESDMYPVRRRSLGGDADPKTGECGWEDLRILSNNNDVAGIRANNEHELSMGRVWAAATEGRLAVIDVDGDSYVETDDDGNPVVVREEDGKQYYTPEGAWQSKVAFVEAELDRRGITVYAKVLSPNKRGGAHFYVEGHPEVRNKTGINVTNPLWTKVDVRGYGGMIYLPGSRRKKPGHNGGTYEVEFNHLADLVDDTGDPKARAALLALYNEMYQPARNARTLPELSKIDLNKVADKYSRPRQLRGEFRGESRANRQLRDDWILADLANLAATPKGGRHDALLRTAYGLSHWCKKTGLDPRWIVETLVIICKNDWNSRTLNSDLATIQDGIDYGYDSPRPWPSTRKAAAKGEKPAKPAGAVVTKAAIEEAMRAEAIRNGQAPEPTAQDDAAGEDAPELDYTDPTVLAELTPDQMDWDKVPGGRAEWFGLAEEDSQAVADHWYNHRGQDWMHTSDDRWFQWDNEHGVWEVASDVAMWEDVKAHVNLWVQLARLARLDGLPDHEYVAAFRTDSRRHRQVLDWVTRDSRLNVPLDHLDRNPYLFAFYDGQTWDSKTCTGRPSRREDRLTRYLSFPMPDVAMRHPDTDMVLRLWGPQDSELHRYAQARWAEMVRPRYIPDQRILVVHGPKGDDGKSMFRDVLTRSCRKLDKTNPYVGNLPLELFTHGKDSVQRLNAMSGLTT